MSKLGAFKPRPAAAEPVPAAAAPATSSRGRGNLATGKSTVALTLKVQRDTWRDLHALSIHSGRSISALALEGLALIAEREGMPLAGAKP